MRPEIASSAVWEMALALLCEQGHSEKRARAFVGQCLKAWDEVYVREAVLAAIGKTDAKSYMKAVLSKKPPRKPPPNGQGALIPADPPSDPQRAKADYAAHREKLFGAIKR